MKDKVLNLVSVICNEVSTDCRGISKSKLARNLMDLASIPGTAELREIPVDWKNQVVILFVIPNDDNYYSLFAGIGTDDKFHFDLSITGNGILDTESEYYNFFDEEEALPIDYFVNKNSVQEADSAEEKTYNHIAQNYAAYELELNSPEEMLTLLNILEAHGESLEDIANYTSHAIDNIFNSDITRKDIVQALMECNVFFDGENSDYLQDREVNFLKSGLASGRIFKTTNGYVEINIV